jgi:CRISPR-associated protein Cmr2
MKYFHFTIGPVQGFVSQARRTRDFWAGSFILSWLSAVAMRSVTVQGGKIIFPMADENFLKWLEGMGRENCPRQGSVPNRFKAEVENDFEPKNIIDSVQIAWGELAELVWQDLAFDVDEKTLNIWNRQVGSFWDISWALSDDEAESDLLDRRKNWRNYFAPVESGVKCSVMEGWQELSGVERPDKKKLGEFWLPIKEKLKRDLAKNECGFFEHLCAIAFIKRRFSFHFKNLGKNKSIKMPDGWELRGWDLSFGIPSVSFLAAVPWLKKVIKNADVALLEKLVQLANELGDGNKKVPIKSINELFVDKLKLNTSDGDVFFENELSNPNKYPKQDKVKSMLEILNEIAIKPSPFYAILLMDGDKLGKKMGNLENQTDISDALHSFTNKVADVVFKNDGFLVYAGGDDVLAILPVMSALECANAVREAYREAFKDKNDEVKDSTISAAIEFVHTHTPLTSMLRDAHDLLDNVAKEKTGRDAVAVRVWKRGGMALEWAMKWEKALDGNNELVIEKLVRQFQVLEGDGTAFSSKFFYNIRERFELFNDDAKKLSDENECALLAVDYMNSGVNDTRIKEEQLDFARAKEEIKPLLKQCRQNGVLKVDGALLVRFLAGEGRKYL